MISIRVTRRLCFHPLRPFNSSRVSRYQISSPPLNTSFEASRCASTKTSLEVPQLVAHSLGDAQQPRHLQAVHQSLWQDGILKVTLKFPDDKSQYLQHLLLGLHKHHGHGRPITHSASRGWFWDVRPNKTTFQTANHQARSETMQEFPWHTDCSYEEAPPRFFALQVLQHDRYGGGTLSVMKVERLSELLSPATRQALHRPEYRISIPPEFIKSPDQRHIVGSILAREEHEDEQSTRVRFREEIVNPVTASASHALQELRAALRDLDAASHSTLHLTAGDLCRQSIILMDNSRWLHARNEVRDPERHLRRVRWHAVPFARAGF